MFPSGKELLVILSGVVFSSYITGLIVGVEIEALASQIIVQFIVSIIIFVVVNSILKI